MPPNEKANASNPLLSLPASTFSFSICQYLAPHDILALRATSRGAVESLNEQDDQAFEALLLLHFGYKRNTDDDCYFSLRCNRSAESGTSIFGVDPQKEDILLRTDRAFVAWKHWVKASLIFFHNKEHKLHAPYFLRAAKFWKSILHWCDSAGEFGQGVKQTFSRKGRNCEEWNVISQDFGQQPGLKAAQAVFAFCSGQGEATTIDEAFSGILGGYEAYGYFSCTHLRCQFISLGRGSPEVCVAACRLSPSRGLAKLFTLAPDTGAITLVSGSNSRCDVLNLQSRTSSEDDILVWLEEYATRLEAGMYGIGNMNGNEGDQPGIALYPRIPRGSPPSSVLTDGKIETVSRAVTRGVEVVASAVFVPQGARQFGFIYSIRIRLIMPDEPDYVSEQDRGYATCQLRSRHWEIVNDATGETNRVDGDGVIGMFPKLMEGGYELDGEEFSGVFQYQSCSGYLERGGSFGGHMHFVPSPPGRGFDVRMNPFSMTTTPDFLY